MVNKIRSTFTGLYTLDEVWAVCLCLLTEVWSNGVRLGIGRIVQYLSSLLPDTHYEKIIIKGRYKKTLHDTYYI